MDDENEVFIDWTPEVAEKFAELPIGALMEAAGHAVRASDGPESFAIFYELVHGRPLPRHGVEWVAEVYRFRAEGRGSVIEAFRGSTKTTIVTITFVAYRIGKSPHLSNLLIQVGDDIASDNTAQIADIIANNPGWRVCFPNVVPDRERGWGAGGYEVKRTDIPYDDWRAKNSSRKDPTLVGVGYKSREIIGKHPDGMLVVDDIHDENNTSSERELAMVRKVLTDTIFPTMTRETWAIFIGTPWVEDDCLGYVKATGMFGHVRTTIYGEDGKSVWPEQFTEQAIEMQKALVGTYGFARMFLLDLVAAKTRVFKYQTFPSSQVRYSWPVAGGCDYASHRDYKKLAEGKGDYFALAYVMKLPGGGAVIVDGVLDRCTQAQAELYLLQAQTIWQYYLGTAVESVGKGDDFVQVVMRNPGLRIVPKHSGRLNKDRRLMIGMQPWLENGTIKICDAETPFLNELRRELDNYPGGKDDCLDAVFYAMTMVPDVLTIPEVDEDGLPVALGLRGRDKQKPLHPAYAFGRR